MEKLQKERNVASNQIINYRFDSKEYEGMSAQQMFVELNLHIIF